MSSPSTDVVTMDPIVIVSTMTKKQERKLVKRLCQELTQLHEDLKRARESDKNDSTTRESLMRQRAKVIEVEKELERYFDDDRLEE